MTSRNVISNRKREIFHGTHFQGNITRWNRVISPNLRHLCSTEKNAFSSENEAWCVYCTKHYVDCAFAIVSRYYAPVNCGIRYSVYNIPKKNEWNVQMRIHKISLQIRLFSSISLSISLSLSFILSENRHHVARKVTRTKLLIRSHIPNGIVIGWWNFVNLSEVICMFNRYYHNTWTQNFCGFLRSIHVLINESCQHVLILIIDTDLWFN